MYFHFKIFSILTIIVLAVIVVCLIARASASTNSPPRATKSGRRWMKAEDPVYVQNFVSRMMGKHPLKDMPVEDGVSGISYGPNLGYEPYWTNVPDRPWKDKCSRCPDLFKRYKTVCAMDSTGDVLVNITMCKLLQMNCLAGEVEGNSTGKYLDFKDDYFVVKDGWARFAVRQEQNLVVHLSQNPDLKGPSYTMLIDDSDWSRRWSRLDKNNKFWRWSEKYDYRALWREEGQWTEFVIHWNYTSGWLLATLSRHKEWNGRYRVFYFNVIDEHKFPIKYIAIGGARGDSGQWAIKGFVVTQLAPCRDHRPGNARFLVTSPTHAPYIMSRISPVNNDFFSMVEREGVQQGNATHFGNVSFLTREEY